MRTYAGRPGYGIKPGKDNKEVLFVNNKVYKKNITYILNKEVKQDESVIELFELHKDELDQERSNMRLNKKQKTIIERGLRSLGAVLVSTLVAWLAGPDAAELVGGVEQQAMIIAVLTPVTQMIGKSLRYGNDEGENPNAKVFTIASKHRGEVDGPDEGDNGHE